MQENKQEKSPIKRKILQYLEYKGISQYEFYQKTGITRGILGQKNGISEENISRFLAYYSDISPEWLLTGAGDMLRSSQNRQPSNVSPVPKEGSCVSSCENQEGRACDTKNTIPLIPIAAMAGMARGEMSVMDYECERYVVPAFSNADYLIQVSGDSMVPKYHSGDLVACKKQPMSDIFFQWNRVYVLDTKLGAFIKRIKRGCDTEHVLIVSDNPEYDPFELHVEQINSVALVVGLIRTE